MMHKVRRIHFVAANARRRVRACSGRLRGLRPRSADTDEGTT
jgi:hypothetical protein